MRLLLDTHAFIWWITDHERLSPLARELIGDGDNEVFFSVASAWEIVSKASIGRVELDDDTDAFIGDQVARNAFQVLPIHLRHALGVGALPELHRDPFDRILVSQAILEALTLVSADDKVAAYPVDVRW